MKNSFSFQTIVLLFATAAASFIIVVAAFSVFESIEVGRKLDTPSAEARPEQQATSTLPTMTPAARPALAEGPSETAPILVTERVATPATPQPAASQPPVRETTQPPRPAMQVASAQPKESAPAFDQAVLDRKCSGYDAGRNRECVEACPYDVDAIRDGDFARNCADIIRNRLKYEDVKFEEGGRTWHLQVLTNPAKPQGPLWFIPHDNENVAFDSGIYGLITYGGVLVAVETGGERENQGQDPNRNFDAGTGQLCPLQRASSKKYTREIVGRWNGIDPIIALHSNTPGGGISINKATGLTKPYPGAKSATVQPENRLLFAPEDTLVFMASPLAGSPRVEAFKTALNAQGINVLWEHVDTTHNDCSLSNYAALKRIENYFNVEVAHSNSRGSRSDKAQKRIIDVIIALNGNRNATSQQTGALQAPSDRRRVE